MNPNQTANKGGRPKGSKTKPPRRGVDARLLRYLDGLLKKVMDDQKASLTDKMKVIDRRIDLEKIRLKITEDGEGSFFRQPEEGADDEDE